MFSPGRCRCARGEIGQGAPGHEHLDALYGHGANFGHVDDSRRVVVREAQLADGQQPVLDLMIAVQQRSKDKAHVSNIRISNHAPFQSTGLF